MKEIKHYTAHWHASPFPMVMGFGAGLLMMETWIHGMLKGEKLPQNPWGSQSLEWTSAALVAGQGNFPSPVTVAEDWHPYKYIDNPKPTFQAVSAGN